MNQSIIVDKAFKQCKDVVVEDEINGDVYDSEKTLVLTTRSQKSLHQDQASTWTFDFSKDLVMPWIDRVTYSVVLSGSGFVQHVARPPKGTTVTVELSAPSNATVTVEVMQCP